MRVGQPGVNAAARVRFVPSVSSTRTKIQENPVKDIGKLDQAALQALVEQERIDTVVAAFPDIYGRLIGKRFSARHYLESVAKHGTHACNYLLTVDMEMEPIGGYEFANWTKGYGDFHLVPDPATLRIASWLDSTAFVVCDLYDDEHQLLPIAPRSALKLQLDRAAERGLSAMAGSEAEYYIYQQSYRQAHRRGYRNLRPAGDYIEDYHILQGTREEPFNGWLRRHLERSGVPVECTKGEWGLGQHELNLKYCEALEMSDRQLLYKQCAKELADAMGLSVTFMAKPHARQAGSSCHVHLSLWRGDAVNAFVGEESLGGIPCSDTFRHFLGGWMKHAAEIMVLMAPNINSYKRYQAGSWAPTRLAWARDNRTAGFRVVGSGRSLRIECRIPGADCNPYLVYAGALAAGLDGIAHGIEPPAIFTGNAYETTSAPHVPATLRDATELFADSDFTNAAFGEAFVQHYAHFFRTEQKEFDQAVTDWERQRYYERI
jgi:glutamine synthetase